MDSLITILGSGFIFCALYFEVFLLISLFETKNKRKGEKKIVFFYPPVTIIVPVWNEEKTIEGTLTSLLALDYPKDKLHIMVVDDGSTDNTQEVLKKYAGHPIIEIHSKQNGGKYTALNFGITHMKTDFVGCLDADSFVHTDALKNIMRRFQDEDVMAVTPSMVIEKPNNTLRKMQRAEYSYGNFMRKAYASIGAIHITPGPFSFFRKKVFDIVGPYKHAHNTEDMEMAMRMQSHHMKIVNASDAIVYTVGPDTIKKLYKQRVRWVSGFLANLIDYRHMVFNKSFGDLGILVLPFAIISICLSFVFVGISLYQILEHFIELCARFFTLGFDAFTLHSFNWFFVDTSVFNILSFVLIGFIMSLIMYGYRTVHGRWKISAEIFYFLFLYSFIAPFWLIKSVYNNMIGKTASWR